ncbi:MAG: hypothetical protein R3C31_02545 [Hyphomonadaceae bacterium]
MERRLQPLRIPIGWSVHYNDFHEIDQDDPEAWHWRKENLLQLSHERRDRLLDLGWYPPDDANGRYVLVLHAHDFTGPELERFESRDRAEIVAEVERLAAEVNSRS